MTDLDQMINEIENIIDGYGEKVTYAQGIGALEMIKTDLIEDAKKAK